jgi:glycosyltransferase involved in cell wall biosynthesis
MKFSIIIPAYNAETTIENCIQALLSQSVERNLYEIIVVDDGSKDRTAEIIHTFPVNYHFQENQGPAAARNKGAQLSKGEIILFTDSDCVPDRFWLERMAAPFSENPSISGVKGAYKSRQSSLTARFAQAEYEDRFGHLKERCLSMRGDLTLLFPLQIMRIRNYPTDWSPRAT